MPGSGPAPQVPLKTTAVDPKTGKVVVVPASTNPNGTGRSAVAHANVATDQTSYRNPRDGTTLSKDKQTVDNTPVDDLAFTISPVVRQITTTNGMGVFNPPQHFATRSFNPLAEKATYPSGRLLDRHGRVMNDKQIQAAQASYIAQSNRSLGYFFQSPDNQAYGGANTNYYNGNGNQGQSRANRNGDKLWGFQFAYNPPSVTISGSVDTAIDWILQDPAVPMKANMSVTFQLWLNRLADIHELTFNQPCSKNYPRTISVVEANGIINRGTEYDLEFLFRTTNGDPYMYQPLLSYGNGANQGLTADTGVLMGRLIWLNLGGEGSNMRYMGQITSLTVNHLIFSRTMVPLLSTVDISFARFPTLNSSNPPADSSRSGTNRDPNGSYGH